MDDTILRATKFGRKMLAELKQFMILSVYLYICFGAVILYAVSVLRSHGVDYSPYGIALIRALIMAKFILIGDSLDIGKIHGHVILIHSVMYKSIIYLVFLIILSVLEEVAMGLLHGHAAVAVLSGIGGGTGLQILAKCFLLWLILLPIVGIQEISKVLGPGVLHRMFFVADRSRPY